MYFTDKGVISNAKQLQYMMTTKIGQQAKIDSLLLHLQTAKADADKVNILNELGWEGIIEGDFSKSRAYLIKAKQLAQKLDFREGLANSLSHMGRICEFEGDYVHSLEYQFKALKIREEINDKKGISYSLHYLGDIYHNQGGLSDNFSSLMEYNNKALEQFFKSLKIAEEIGDKQSIANTFNCIGNSFREKEDYIKAIEYYFMALKLREELGDKQGFAVTYNNIGRLYVKQRDYTKALEYLFKSLKLAEEIGDKRAIVKVLGSIGNCYLKENNYSKALEFCSKSLSFGKEINFLEFIVNANHSISQIYESQNFDGHSADVALKYYKEYINGLNTINTKKLAQAEIKFEFEKKEAVAKVEHELLLNILPSEVAEELKAKGRADAKQFDEVTVMFTDFKDFTQISEKLSPLELVAEIHTCFEAFDNIIGKHNIEKIKTIGDSYMCAGGLPLANKTNATDVVYAAIEIQQFIKEHYEQRKNNDKEAFEIRIGIHTGAVVAGIVGVKKFAYDIWGDTVNIASRMESSGEAGKVNISGNTYELVKDKFTCTHRGKIEAKHKGEIDMYFVESISSLK